MAAKVASFNSEVFDRSVRTLLQRLPAEKIPNALNKKMFFVVLAALAETPRTNPFKILSELGRAVTLKREDGSMDSAPIGYALAAKRASKAWGPRREALSSRNRKANLMREWQKLVAKKLDAMFGARMRSTAFIKAGWVSVLKALGPHVRGKGGRNYDRSGVRGSAKGAAKPAQPGWSPKVMVENTAAARSDKRDGFSKHAGPAFQRAFDREMADWPKYLQDEILKEEMKEFNAKQH